MHLQNPRVAVVVGNPRPGSRTLAAAVHVARELSGGESPGLVVDLADLVVVATPTYKGTYTGLLKLFLDRFSTQGLRGVAIPLMLGAGPALSLAPELTLRPVLVEIGACVPAPGLYVLESAYDDPAAYEPWLARARPAVFAVLDKLTHDNLGTGAIA